MLLLAQHRSTPPPRMRDDALLHAPFDSNFTLTILEDHIAHQTLAKRRETYHIDRLRATTDAGYNEAPGSTTPAFWWRLRHGALARK
jgi:hypothetical protein